MIDINTNLNFDQAKKGGGKLMASIYFQDSMKDHCQYTVIHILILTWQS
jgi:hypothetical protein